LLDGFGGTGASSASFGPPITVFWWHFGHSTDLPTRSSHAENVFPQLGQVIRIGMLIGSKLL
jgi:hypothetical protein